MFARDIMESLSTPSVPAPNVPRRGARAFVLAGLMALVGGVAVTGCASDDDSSVSVNYSMTAKQNYDKGLAELKAENYPEARKYFTFVRQKFPFSKFAVLAELALADALFQRGEYQSAIDGYKAFIRLHPTHERVEDGYVAFRICESYVQEMPEDWLILPPAYEKDQAAVYDALRELSDFLDKYPDSQFVDQARKRRREVVRRLVEHEVYVARFYLDEQHPKAAIMRLEGAIRRYPDSGREAELLLTLGQTHLQLGNNKTAQETFMRVVEEYRGEPQANRAQVYLKYIRDRFGPTPADQPPTNDDKAGNQRGHNG